MTDLTNKHVFHRKLPVSFSFIEILRFQVFLKKTIAISEKSILPTGSPLLLMSSILKQMDQSDPIQQGMFKTKFENL